MDNNCQAFDSRELINDQDWKAVECQFSNTHPYNYAIVDNFLTSHAWSELRANLVNNKAWELLNVQGDQRVLFIRDFRHPFAESIAAFLVVRLPGILGGLSPVECRAFMSRQNEGLEIHSDNGAVTLNIYLTPEEFNLKPNSGGLLLYDVKRTKDQAIHEFNSQPWATKYFEKNTRGAKRRIGYAFNRAVIFDAKTFHAAESMCFTGESVGSHRLNLALRFDNPEKFHERFERYIEAGAVPETAA